MKRLNLLAVLTMTVWGTLPATAQDYDLVILNGRVITFDPRGNCVIFAGYRQFNALFSFLCRNGPPIIARQLKGMRRHHPS